MHAGVGSLRAAKGSDPGYPQQGIRALSCEKGSDPASDPIATEFGYRRRMSTYHLQSVFRPQSVAVIGGSPRERSAGRAVMRNLRGTG